MTGVISTVKREIRILGLDTCRPGKIFGAVIRGGEYLDGVMLFPREEEASRVILGSRYYLELRAIMIHDPASRLDPKTIEKQAKLPVIRVSNSRTPPRPYQRVPSKHGILWVQSNLPSQVLKNVLNVTWTFGNLPEPARVAHLLARARIDLTLSLGIKNKFAARGRLGAE